MAYVGAIGLSVTDLLLHPPTKTYVVAPDDDWTRCVEVRATSESLARREAQRHPASRAKDNGDCAVLPAVRAMDQRLVLARGFNTLLVVSAILAALWIALVAARAWRQDATSIA